MEYKIEKWKISLNLVYPPIVKLNGLLGKPTCKEQKHLSEDFIYFHYWRGYRIVNFSKKNLTFQYSRWTIFPLNSFLKK